MQVYNSIGKTDIEQKLHVFTTPTDNLHGDLTENINISEFHVAAV